MLPGKKASLFSLVRAELNGLHTGISKVLENPMGLGDGAQDRRGTGTHWSSRKTHTGKMHVVRQVNYTPKFTRQRGKHGHLGRRSMNLALCSYRQSCIQCYVAWKSFLQQ